MASVTDTAFAAGEPLTAYHLGAGGLTLPRYLSASGRARRASVGDRRRGGRGRRRLLGGRCPTASRSTSRTAASASTARPTSLDLIVGDAFGGVSVPWHLDDGRGRRRFEEALAEDGVYVANLIDFGPLEFARAAVATTAERVRPRGLLAEPALAGEGGGNLVVVASRRAARHRRGGRRGWASATSTGTRSTGGDLDAWIGDAPVLTDDYAPVDQLLTPYAR